MSNVAVHIMLHGLMALVPVDGADGHLNHMTALLLDARQPRDIQCFVPHKPTLTFVTSNVECVAAGCSVSSQECTCDLDGQEITLSPDVQPPGQNLNPAPTTSLPFNREKATDFAYIANLESNSLGQTLNPAFLAPVPPSTLVARMTFPFESAKACSLGTRRDEEGDNVHPMSFRPMGTLEEENEMSQALAQVLMTHYMLPGNGTANPTLTLTLSKFGGADPRSMVLQPGPNGYSISLANMRVFNALPDDPCDDGVGRDFALLYDLAQNPPAWEERKIPHVKYTRWKSAVELFDEHCQGMKDPGSRPICPMGSFYVPEGASQ